MASSHGAVERSRHARPGRLAKLRRDFFRRGADQDAPAARAGAAARAAACRAALVLAAENHEQRPGKRFDGLERGVHVRGLRIVVELDAADFGDEFQPVLDSRERLHAARDRRRARRPPDRPRRRRPERFRRCARRAAGFRRVAPERLPSRRCGKRSGHRAGTPLRPRASAG